MSNSASQCEKCGGTGFRVRQVDGYDRAAPCECRRQSRAERLLKLLKAANVPERYRHCTLDCFNIIRNNMSLRSALARARDFVVSFPGDSGRGLLLTGGPGVGKTHLAVGILQALVQEKGVPSLFVDFRDLLKEIQETYNPSNPASALQVLAPVFQVDLLVLDDLAVTKPTEWVRDTLGHIINKRYNEEKTTLFTSNFSDRQASDDPAGRTLDLSARIGISLRSRLHEMCDLVPIEGDDFRQIRLDREIS